LHFEVLKNGNRSNPFSFLAGNTLGADPSKATGRVSGGGGGDGGFGILTWLIEKIGGLIKKIREFAFSGEFGKLIREVPMKIIGWVKDKAMDLIAKFFSSPTGNATPGAMQYAAAALGKFGWTQSQWPALKALWQNESGWNHRARNPSSGAYGIPQALPPSKMASAGRDWRTNYRTQIEWGLGYIKSRYGSPSRAWRAWQSRSPHWYGKGGMIDEKIFGVGESGRKYVFGEHGREWVMPDHTMRRMANGSGSGVGGDGGVVFERGAIVVNIEGDADEMKVERAMKRVLSQELPTMLRSGAGRRL